jgi:hypothetical protein
VYCEYYALSDPLFIPEKSFWPFALWYSAFVIYLFTHNVFSSLGFVFIWRYLRIAIVTLILWTNSFDISSIASQTSIFHFNFLTDWLDIVIALAALALAYLIVEIFDFPRLIQQHYRNIDEMIKDHPEIYIKSQLSTTVRRNLQIKYKETRMLNFKYWAFLYISQYFLLLFLYLGIHVEFLFYIAQVASIIFFAFIGIRTKIEHERIWEENWWRFRTFIVTWLLIFVIEAILSNLPFAFYVSSTQVNLIVANFFVILFFLLVLWVKISQKFIRRRLPSFRR